MTLQLKLRDPLSGSGQVRSSFCCSLRLLCPSLASATAFALKSAGDELAMDDTRYQRLTAWVSRHLDLTFAGTHDVAFAAEVVKLDGVAQHAGAEIRHKAP